MTCLTIFKLKNNVNAKRHQFPQIFATLYPTALRAVLERKMMRILKNRDQYGRHIVIFRPGDNVQIILWLIV